MILTDELCDKLCASAREKSKELDIDISFAISDENGLPRAYRRYGDGAILKKWTAKSERWYNNKKRRERHGKHQVYRGIQAKHSKLV